MTEGAEEAEEVLAKGFGHATMLVVRDETGVADGMAEGGSFLVFLVALVAGAAEVVLSSGLTATCLAEMNFERLFIFAS